MTNHHVASSRCPKSFFKALFVETPLSRALRNIKMSKAVADGLKSQECERGSSPVKPPIPYIPEKDKLQEAVESTALIKFTLPTTVEFQVSVWSRVPRRTSSCRSNKLSQPSRIKAYKKTTRSLFRP